MQHTPRAICEDSRRSRAAARILRSVFAPTEGRRLGATLRDSMDAYEHGPDE